MTALPSVKNFDQKMGSFFKKKFFLPLSFFFEFSPSPTLQNFVLKMARPRKDSSWAAVVTTAAKKAMSKKKSAKSNKSGGEADDLFDGYSGMGAFDAQRQRGQEQKQHQFEHQFQQTAEEEEANDADSSLKQILTQRLEGRVGGPTRRSAKGGWTPAEDDVLRRAVAIYKGKNWKKIGAFEYILYLRARARAKREKTLDREKRVFFLFF